MATYISLLSFTDQGIRNIKDSPARSEDFRKMVEEKLGITLKSIYWTVGRYDIVLIMEGSDEDTTTALLKLCSLGNVRSETLRGYSKDEFKNIISHIPIGGA